MALEPEWVHVWWWARNIRHPRELRPFPQQASEYPDTLTLSLREVANLTDEWRSAGSPKTRKDVLLPDLDAILG